MKLYRVNEHKFSVQQNFSVQPIVFEMKGSIRPQKFHTGYSAPKLSQMQYVRISLLWGKWVVKLFVFYMILIFLKQETSDMNLDELRHQVKTTVIFPWKLGDSQLW